MRAIELPVNQNTQQDEVYDHGGGDKLVAKPDARQAFSVAVIFGDGLQLNAPPKVSVNLKVPLVPPTNGGRPPPFLLEELKNRAEKMVAIFPLLAPINSASSVSDNLCAGG